MLFPLLTAFLKRDALAGGFHDEVQGLGHAPRQVPKPADEGQGDELFGGEVLLHGLESGVVPLGRQVRYFLRPADSGFFLLVEQIAVPPAVALQQIDFLLRDTLSPTELDVVPESVIAFGENGRLDDDELGHVEVFRVGFLVLDPQLAVHDLPALDEAGRPAEQAQKARHFAPALHAALIEGGEFRGQVFRNVLGVDERDPGKGAGHHLLGDAHVLREAGGFVYRHDEFLFS